MVPQDYVSHVVRRCSHRNMGQKPRFSVGFVFFLLWFSWVLLVFANFGYFLKLFGYGSVERLANIEATLKVASPEVG